MGTYWESRKRLNYYKQVLDFARQYVPAGRRLLDVGAHNCQYLAWFDWFDEKLALDLRWVPKLEGVTGIKGDFMVYEPDAAFDLVLCLQVLEHLDEPAAFCQKRLTTGHRIIISVPYKWRRGVCADHVQDPVDEHKLRKWAGRPALDQAIIQDGKLRRLVAVYEGAQV